MNCIRSGSSSSMRKTSQKRQNFTQSRKDYDDNWVVKPLNEGNTNPLIDDQNQTFIDVDEKERKPESSSISYSKPSNRRKPKRAPKNRGAHVEKSNLGSNLDVGGSNIDEIRSGLREKNGGVEVKEGVEEFDLNEECDEGNDVVRGLEKLEMGVEEVELSEEQVKINDQAQEDELLAMESIYGDNVYVLEKQRGLRSFQIHIHIELPSEFPVTAKLKTSGHSSPRVDGSDGFSYTFKVQYLSPIVLTCLLPRSYPSHCPPSFTISVQWLHKSRISELCSMLDSLWNEQPGQEILYQWVEWLHGSSLSFFGFGEELVLGPYGVKNDSDKRAFSGCVSPDVDIPSMKSYNDKRQHENFLSTYHECCICFCEYAGSEFLRLPCHHFFCEKCMKTYADVHIKEGTVNKLQCPNTKCGGMIPPGLLKRLVGDEEFERWETLMLQKTLDGMADVAYCPRCETACLEDEDHHAQCSKCFFSFCNLCRERRHVGIQCMTPEMKLKILEERQNSSNLKNTQKIKEREMINELRSVAQIFRDAKQCPSCKMAISRIDGCNKMSCTNCGQFFCYRCGKAIDGYDHFRDGGCELFPQEAIMQWEEQLNDRQRIGQLQAIAFAGNARPCPGCRQLNAKVGNNNHIFCWSCQTITVIFAERLCAEAPSITGLRVVNNIQLTNTLSEIRIPCTSNC